MNPIRVLLLSAASNNLDTDIFPSERCPQITVIASRSNRSQDGSAHVLVRSRSLGSPTCIDWIPATRIVWKIYIGNIIVSISPLQTLKERGNVLGRHDFFIDFFLSDLKRGFVKRDCLKIHLRKKSHCLMPPKYVGIIIISVTIFLNNLIYLHSSKIIFGSVCFLEDSYFLDVSQNVSPRGMKKVKWLWILYFLRVKHFYFILVPRSLIIVKFSLI